MRASFLENQNDSDREEVLPVVILGIFVSAANQVPLQPSQEQGLL